MKSKITVKNKYLNKSIRSSDYLVVGSDRYNKIEVMTNLPPMELITMLMPLLHEIELALDEEITFQPS